MSQSKPWVQLAGYVSLACGILALIGAFAVFLALDADINMNSAILLFEIFLACCYFTPAIYLLRYGQAIADANKRPSAASLAEALRMQLRYWRFIGLLLSIGVSLAVIAIAFAILIPMLWRFA